MIAVADDNAIVRKVPGVAVVRTDQSAQAERIPVSRIATNSEREQQSAVVQPQESWVHLAICAESAAVRVTPPGAAVVGRFPKHHTVVLVSGTDLDTGDSREFPVRAS